MALTKLTIKYEARAKTMPSEVSKEISIFLFDKNNTTKNEAMNTHTRTKGLL